MSLIPKKILRKISSITSPRDEILTVNRVKINGNKRFFVLINHDGGYGVLIIKTDLRRRFHIEEIYEGEIKSRFSRDILELSIGSKTIKLKGDTIALLERSLPIISRPPSPGFSQYYNATTVNSRTESFSMRERLMHSMLEFGKEEFSDLKKYSLICITWNVNNQSPQEKLISLFPESVDIYAIALQEVDMSVKGIMKKPEGKALAWRGEIEHSLNFMFPGHYKLVGQKQLAGICLFIYTKITIEVSEVSTSAVAVGVGGVLGNKGGVGIRLRIDDSPIIFISAHLAAHSSNVKKRNRDQRDILDGLKFGNKNVKYQVEDSDEIFFMGDLNYRINNLSRKEIILMMEEWERIMTEDQLKTEMRHERAFEGFSEGDIRFPCTYKFDPGTINSYDTSEKHREPAWTDRILWKGRLKIKQKNYKCYSTFITSDHKPVSSYFYLKTLISNPEKLKKYHNKIHLQLDRLENESIPDINIPDKEFEFEFKYNIIEHIYLKLHNRGRVFASYTFVPKPGDIDIISPSWLIIDRPKGIIPPGKKITIHMTTRISNDTVNVYPIPQRFDEILVIHIEGGNDHFISIRGDFQRTCFGLDLNDLLMYPNGVQNKPLGKMLLIPRELWILIEWIKLNGMNEKYLFIKPGYDEEKKKIRNSLDNCENISNVSPLSVAETLLDLIYSFKTPLIESVRDISDIWNLPTSHINTIIYLISFMKYILSFPNKLTIQSLSLVFSSTMLRTDSRKLIKRASGLISRLLTV